MGVPQQHIEVWQWWILTELPLRQEQVQELLHQPVESPEGHVVAGPSFISIVQLEAHQEVGLELSDAVVVCYCKWVSGSHHQIYQHTVGRSWCQPGSQWHS